MNREAREVHSLGCTNQVVNVGKTAHVVQHLGMPPCTEEVELSGDGVLLFIGSIGKEFQVSKAGIALADAVPRIVEYVVSETVVGAMVGTRTIHVGETAAPVVEVCTEVTKVEVVGNVWRISCPPHSPGSCRKKRRLPPGQRQSREPYPGNLCTSQDPTS